MLTADPKSKGARARNNASAGLDSLMPALLAVARDMNSERSLDRLLQYLPQAVSELTGAERCTIFLLDPEKGELYSKVAMQAGQEIRVRLGEGIAGHVAATGKTLRIDSAYDDPRFSSARGDKLTGFVTRNVLCAPLRHLDGSVLGVFQVLNKRAGSFDEADEELLALFGSHAAVALETARLLREKDSALSAAEQSRREVSDQMTRLGALYAIQKQINEAAGLDEVLDSVLRHTAEMFDAEAGSILLASPSEQRLYFRHSYGGKAAELQASSISLKEGIAGWVYEHRSATLVNAPAADPRFNRGLAGRIGYEVRSLLAAPLMDEDRVAGVLEVLNRRGRGFEPGDLNALEFVAGQIFGTLQKQILLDENRKAQRLASIGNTASRIVHDLKNPMTVLRGMLQMFQESDLPAAQREKYARVGIGEIDRSVEMMQEILDFSRGTASFEFERVILAPLLDEVMASVESTCRQKSIRVRIDLPGATAVRADPSRLRRAFSNLVRNAVEALPEGGSLEVTGQRSEEGLELRFTDDGPGVPAEIRPRLFEAFATHGKSHGTGLGLAIARSIVEGHQGRLELDCGHSRGACFVCRLPTIE